MKLFTKKKNILLLLALILAIKFYNSVELSGQDGRENDELDVRIIL